VVNAGRLFIGIFAVLGGSRHCHHLCFCKDGTNIIGIQKALGLSHYIILEVLNNRYSFTYRGILDCAYYAGIYCQGSGF
jgi:hypothetical protein